MEWCKIVVVFWFWGLDVDLLGDEGLKGLVFFGYMILY